MHIIKLALLLTKQKEKMLSKNENDLSCANLPQQLKNQIKTKAHTFYFLFSARALTPKANLAYRNKWRILKDKN